MCVCDAEYEEEEAMELILRAKPKVDAGDPKKMTALHVAAGKGNLDVVKLLVRLNLTFAIYCLLAHLFCLRRLSEVVRT